VPVPLFGLARDSGRLPVVRWTSCLTRWSRRQVQRPIGVEEPDGKSRLRQREARVGRRVSHRALNRERSAFVNVPISNHLDHTAPTAATSTPLALNCP
jgi:hypothetical protein